jgi:hypothetical protein
MTMRARNAALAASMACALAAATAALGQSATTPAPSVGAPDVKGGPAGPTGSGPNSTGPNSTGQRHGTGLQVGPAGGLGTFMNFRFDFHRKVRPAPPSVPAPAPAPATDDRLPDSVIVVIDRDGIDIAGLARTAGVTVVETSRLQSLPLTTVVARLRPGDTPEAAITRLSGLPGVAWAQANHVFRASGRVAPVPRPYAMAGFSAQTLARPAPGVVAMIDTPAALDHEALRGVGAEQRLFTPTATADAHGTAVAALLVGVGPSPGTGRGAHLVSLAAFEAQPGNAAPTSQTRYLVRAFDAAALLRPNVLNLSFGGPPDRLLEALVSGADQRGICIVAAAGNGGRLGRPPFPASHPAVVGVTAVDDRLNIYSAATPGQQVAVAAIGVDVVAAVPGGYRVVSGTSFAAPFVSGALLRTAACGQRHNPAEMRAAVAAAARDLGQPGRDDIFGAGLFRLPGASRR